jgi:hypothetical protein
MRAELVILQRTEKIVRNRFLEATLGDRQRLEQIAEDVEKKRRLNV